MVKCGGCAKFMAANTAAKCNKCSTSYHRGCADLPEKGLVSVKWICPECKAHHSLSPPEGTTSFRTPETHTNSSSINTHSKGNEEHNIDLALEIRAIRNELSSLRAEFREYREENSEFKSAVNEGLSVMDSRITMLETKFEQIVPSNVDALEDTIAELKYQMNERDQDLLLNDIEIAGIPEHKEENPLHMVKALSMKMGVDVDQRDIVHAERVGAARRNRVEVTTNGSITADPTTQAPRPIVVRLTRRAVRDCLLRAARVRRGITTADMEVAGPARRIYVNERLTPMNRRLFYEARRAAQQHQWKYVWTRDGKILMRKVDGKSVERIRVAKDIVKVFGVSPVCSQ